jgi:D-glycero-D-manno-heptose 1,7-bisphosphate phosphatase
VEFPAIFFDKDGVLNQDDDLRGNLENPRIHPLAARLVARYASDFKIVLATNQPVVARGMFSEEEVIFHLRELERRLQLSDNDARFDGIYYCPHHPQATVEFYRVSCDCRKPKPGMLLGASRELGIDLSRSYFIGDRISDVIAGKLAGCRTVQILSAKNAEPMIQTDLKFEGDMVPDFSIKDLSELVGVIS